MITLYIYVTDDNPTELDAELMTEMERAARRVYRTELYTQRALDAGDWTAGGEDDLGTIYNGELYGRTRSKAEPAPLLANLVVHVKAPEAVTES